MEPFYAPTPDDHDEPAPAPVEPAPTPTGAPAPAADDQADPFGLPVLYSDKGSTATNRWSTDLSTIDTWNRSTTTDTIIQRCGTHRPKKGEAMMFCGSTRRCLLCARYVLMGYRTALTEAVRDVPEVLFMTFTRKNTAASLREEWDALRRIRRRFTRNKFFIFEKEWGITGFSVTTEVNRSRDAWHIHSHWLIAVDHELGGAGERRLIRALQERWVTSAAYVGEAALLSRQTGRSVAPGGDRAQIVEYVSKQDLEYRGEPQSRTPADLLALAASGDEAALRDWQEYSGTLRKVPVIERYGSLSRSRNASSADDSHMADQ